MSETPPLIIRAAREADLEWILPTWRDSYSGADEVKGMPRQAYADAMRRRCERLMRAVGGAVAHAPDDPATLCGWACGDHNVLHYVYVRQKPNFRDMGVARELFAALGSPRVFTHRSPALRGTPKGMTYVPISLFEEKL